MSFRHDTYSGGSVLGCIIKLILFFYALSVCMCMLCIGIRAETITRVIRIIGLQKNDRGSFSRIKATFNTFIRIIQHALLVIHTDGYK